MLQKPELSAGLMGHLARKQTLPFTFNLTNQVNNQRNKYHPLTIQITLTLKMTTPQVVETSVTVTNSSFLNYTHPDDHTRQTTDTPGFKPFTKKQGSETILRTTRICLASIFFGLIFKHNKKLFIVLKGHCHGYFAVFRPILC